MSDEEAAKDITQEYEEATRVLAEKFAGKCWRQYGDKQPVTPDDVVVVSLASDNRTTCSALRFIEVVFSAADGTVDADGTFVGDGITVTRVVPVNTAARTLCEGASMYDLDEQYLFYEADNFVGWLDNGLTELALHYSGLGLSHEFVPECGADWMFLCVSGEVERSALDGVAAAYLFSIEESQGLAFAPERFPEISDEKYADMFPHDETIRSFADRELRALLPADQKEVLKLYLEACALPTASFQILGFARVVEYVATSVERALREDTDRVVAQISDDGIRGRVADLIRRRIRKPSDGELVAQAVEAVWDPLPLVALATSSLGKLGALNSSSSQVDRSGAAEQLSTALYATRNEIAHAKANYQRKGGECRPDEYPQFAALTRALAQQAIYWLVRRMLMAA